MLEGLQYKDRAGVPCERVRVRQSRYKEGRGWTTVATVGGAGWTGGLPKSDSFARSIFKYSKSDDVVWLGEFRGVFENTRCKRIAYGRLPLELLRGGGVGF